MALTETQQTKASVKINHVPTDAAVQTLFNNGSFNPGEIIVTPDEDNGTTNKTMVIPLLFFFLVFLFVSSFLFF